MLPNVFIAGVPKAATSSVHRWLSDHPEVGGSSVKETFYFIDKAFSSFNPNANFNLHGIGPYENFFSHLSKQQPPKIIFESSAEYIYQTTALNQLPDFPTNPKFIFLLREPASQIYSIYQYFRNNYSFVSRDLSFKMFLKLARMRSNKLAQHNLLRYAFDNCYYAKHVNEWVKRCGKDRIQLYLYEDLVRDKRAFMQEIALNLGINPAYYETYSFPMENETYRVRAFWLQAINVKLRDLLPKGPIYHLARKTYRRINTKKGNVTHEERTQRAELRTEFKEQNTQLLEEFDLDLSSWEA